MSVQHAARKRMRQPWPRLGVGIVLALCLGGCDTGSRHEQAGPLTQAAAESASLEQIGDGIDAGEFARAEAAISAALAETSDAQLQAQLAFERERMRRIGMDFGLDKAAALERARRQAPTMSEAQFDAFDAQGLLESMRIDGQLRYFNRAPSNLFRLSAEARAMRTDPDAPFPGSPYEQLHPHHAEVVDAAQATGQRSLVPRRLQVTQSISVKPDAVPDGELIRAWIPYPRVLPGQQEDIVWLGSEPAEHRIAPESALQRTVYLERRARAGEATQFSIQYELSVHAQHVTIDPEQVQPTPDDPALAPYLAEEPPHIVFTDALRLFSARVVGQETQPYRIAQKLFAAVDEIPWGGAREYSTLRNISDHALHAGHADCGQQTLLLIALLRLNGIPARWQSGWTYSDNAVGYDNMHDWGWLYLAPYGWVPMDVTAGLLDSHDERLRWFYLGALDAYRIVFNDAISEPFDPPKQHFRSETVDSQRGEVEWQGGNLYFDQWDYDFKAVILSPAEAAAMTGESP